MRLWWLVSLAVSCSGRGPERTVTFGSLVKLQNEAYDVRLHSHEVTYGSGSHQQSVTGLRRRDDVGSLWVVEGGPRGAPVPCGATLRLAHLTTGRRLHSSRFESPLSRQQEVCCQDEPDPGDDWAVECGAGWWTRGERVLLRHEQTRALLTASGRAFGRPIEGQMEVVGSRSAQASYWSSAEGVFFHSSSPRSHDEF